MAAIFAFTCTCCGEIHEGSPSFAFQAPDPYTGLTPEEKQGMAQLDPDFCTIAYQDHTDYFVRAVLEVPIHGVEDPFLWGIWVSLSEKSFRRYRDTCDAPVEGDGFFGWVCNRIGLYPWDRSRASDVFVQPAGLRPKVILHRGDDGDAGGDPLVIDQANGISIARAQELAERAMHRGRA